MLRGPREAVTIFRVTLIYLPPRFHFHQCNSTMCGPLPLASSRTLQLGFLCICQKTLSVIVGTEILLAPCFLSSLH
jgi:hypothetical protein